MILVAKHPNCNLLFYEYFILFYHPKIRSIPSGRGSCTGSQVMLELILNKTSPKAIILRDVDSILCTGAIVAEEFFPNECFRDDDDDDDGDDGRRNNLVPNMFAVGGENFDLLEDVDFISFIAQEEDNHDDNVSVSDSKTSSVDTVLIQGRKLTQLDSIGNTSIDNVSGCGDTISFYTENLLQRQNHDIQNEYDNDTKGLKLTLEEQLILNGNDKDEDESNNISTVKRLAMRTIVRVASIPLLSSQSKNTKMTKLIPINSAHIDGVTFIGEGGLRFVEELARLGGKVEIPTTLNSQSVDRRRWGELGVSSTFATKANRVGDAYLDLGCELSFTCAPYLIPKSRPSFGEQIMWGESNAVVYANSVVGARTEKYADYFDICAALIGKVPLAGVHLDKNRIPGIVLDASELVREALLLSNEERDIDKSDDIDSFYPTMGWLCGHLSDGKVPLILGFNQVLDDISDDNLKAFCAAYGTTGTSPLFHMAGVTPEAFDTDVINKMLLEHEERKGQTVRLKPNDLMDAYRTLDGSEYHTNESNLKDKDDSSVEKIDLVAFGNPHMSISELKRLTELVQKDQRQKHGDVKVMATLSRHVHTIANKLGYIKALEDFGVTFINDTCWCMMTDEPIIPSSKDAVIMTNSGKYAHYGVGLTNRRLRFGSFSQCINASKSGVRMMNDVACTPSWLKKTNTIRTLVSIAKRLK